MRFFQHLDRLDERRDPLPWLYRVTVNASHDLLRKRRREVCVPPEDARLANRPARASGPGIEARLDGLPMLEQGLQTLPEKERAAVVLRDIQGLSTREAARVLRSSETTVRTQLCRRRRKLRAFRDARLGDEA